MLIFFYHTLLDISCTLVTTDTTGCKGNNFAVYPKSVQIHFVQCRCGPSSAHQDNIVVSGCMACMLGKLDKTERSE